MSLNLFFENVYSGPGLILISISIIAVYWWVLRRSDPLGSKILISCVFLFCVNCIWLYKADAKLKDTISAGEQHIATILSKTKTDDHNNEVEISFTANDGKTVGATTSMYISQQEWDKFETGRPLAIIYRAAAKQTIVQQSIMRVKDDRVYLYLMACLWLLLGAASYIWLRKLKVDIAEKRGAQWKKGTSTNGSFT